MARSLAEPGEGMPAALRKSLVDKFFRFSEYHLSKYNNAKAVARARKKGSSAASSYTLKRLVGMLHISEPKELVMKLLGCKYPATSDAFRASGLPGRFDPSLAGRRMKLSVATTWETQVSARGNKAQVWEDLLDTNSLPFMAMLRNLRNLLQAGVSNKHHKMVMDKLRNPHVIANCRQFPFRFLSAYDAISFDPAEYMEQRLAGTAPVRKPGRRVSKPKPLPPNPPTAKLIEGYRQSLDEAVKLATMCVAACRANFLWGFELGGSGSRVLTWPVVVVVQVQHSAHSWFNSRAVPRPYVRQPAGFRAWARTQGRHDPARSRHAPRSHVPPCLRVLRRDGV